MMDRARGAQQRILCVTMESLMPKDHFLRDLDRLVNFEFIYDRVESLYSHTGRRSIDPVVIVKMMLLGYLYGIDSERRLEQEVQVNIAFRWFLGIDLEDTVPDHSTISQLRRRKFNNTTLFEDIFSEVVRICIEKGLITGKLLLTDSTHVKANADDRKFETIVVEDEPSAYIKRLNEKAVREGLLDENYSEKITAKYKEVKKSTTDPDSGYMHRPGKPNGFFYLSHQTCDSENGLITDVHVTPGNVYDATVHSERIRYQMKKFGFRTEAICADKGYDSSEIHADMYEMGIQTYIPREKTSTKENRYQLSDYIYDAENDVYHCPAGCILPYKSYDVHQGKKRYYSRSSDCRQCQHKEKCIAKSSTHKFILRGLNAEPYAIQCQKNGSPAYYAALRLRRSGVKAISHTRRQTTT